jgi:hypothetical protein
MLIYPVRTCYLNSPAMDVDLGMGGLRRCSVLCLVGISRLTWRCSTPLRCLGGCNSYRIASSFNAWAVASMFSLCSRWSCTLLAYYATGGSSYRVSIVLQSCVVAALFSRCRKICCDDYSRGICVENLQWRPSWVRWLWKGATALIIRPNLIIYFEPTCTNLNLCELTNILIWLQYTNCCSFFG